MDEQTLEKAAAYRAKVRKVRALVDCFLEDNVYRAIGTEFEWAGPLVEGVLEEVKPAKPK